MGWTQTVAATDVPTSAAYHAISTAMLDRAENEYAKIKALVNDGTLPKSRLVEAQRVLDDAQDEAVLAETLHGARIGDMTSDQAKGMVDAAQRRVSRQAKIVHERQMLLDSGVLARSEFAAIQEELDSRQRVLKLALNRAKLADDLRQMASAEEQLERATQSGVGLRYAMVRYDGNGVFDLRNLSTISREFEQRFHHSLPISASGQTLVHQSMGLDHRNRVDIALNPDGLEGIWLRELLERLRVPYLAFRSAVPGAATAPHIHLGTGSTRLRD